MEISIDLVHCLAFGFRMSTQRSQILWPSCLFYIPFSIHSFDYLSRKRFYFTWSNAWNQSLCYSKVGEIGIIENLGGCCNPNNIFSWPSLWMCHNSFLLQPVQKKLSFGRHFDCIRKLFYFHVLRTCRIFNFRIHGTCDKCGS